MRAAVDSDRCRGHGICLTVCPEMFSLNDDGYAQVLSPDVPPEFEKAVGAAARDCPERAIDLS